MIDFQLEELRQVFHYLGGYTRANESGFATVMAAVQS
jgi:hypothetical protein